MRPGHKTVFTDEVTRGTVNKSHKGGFEVYGYDKDDDLCRFAIPSWVTSAMYAAMAEESGPKAPPYRKKKKAKKPEAVENGGE